MCLTKKKFLTPTLKNIGNKSESVKPNTIKNAAMKMYVALLTSVNASMYMIVELNTNKSADKNASVDPGPPAGNVCRKGNVDQKLVSQCVTKNKNAGLSQGNPSAEQKNVVSMFQVHKNVESNKNV